MLNRLKYYETALVGRLNRLTESAAKRRWHNNPFGDQPRATPEKYRKIWEQARTLEFQEIDQLEKQLGHRIPEDWFQELALHTQVVIKDSDICYPHGRLLYTVLADYLDRRKKEIAESDAPLSVTILETGTARGFSSVCMSRALSDAKVAGQIHTFDVLPHDVPMYWNCIDDSEGPKTRRDLLAPWKDIAANRVIFHEGDTRMTLKKVRFGRIDFAFLDGAHTYEDVKREFNIVTPYQESGDVVVFDDYTDASFPGLVRAVDEVCETMGYDKEVVRAGDARGYVIARKK